MSDRCKLILALFLLCSALALACFMAGLLLLGTAVGVGMTTTSETKTNPPERDFDPAHPFDPKGQSTKEPGETTKSGTLAIFMALGLAIMFLLLALLFAYLAYRLNADFRKNCPPIVAVPVSVPSPTTPDAAP